MWNTPLHRSTYGTNLDLTGKFTTGIAQHSVLTGFDLYHYDEHDGPGGPIIGYPNPLNTINVLNPIYGNIDLTKLNPGTFDFHYENNENWYGIYFQDQITLWDKLHILGGGRQDWAESASGVSAESFQSIQKETVRNEFFSPRIGILYQPWPWLSVYGNYVESIGTSNGGLSVSGRPFSPETAQQGEVGIKTEFFDQRLTGTLAFYDLTKQNVLTPDPNNRLFKIAVGEARSRGMELDVAGRLTDNWSLIASYSYIDAKITKDNDDSEGHNNEGHRLTGVPRNSGNLWTKYVFNDGPLRGLTLGSGVYLAGQRQGDLGNTFQLPGYARWDASLGYSFKQFGSKITTQLNVYNILDKEYYQSSGGRLTINPGAPLTFLGSVRVEF